MANFIGPQSAVLELSSCDKEPIHIPGAIQPHGILLAVDDKDLKIFQVSANCEQWLEQVPGSLIGRSLDSLLEHDSVALLRACVAEGADTTSSLRTLQFKRENGDPLQLCASAHRCGDVVIIELESLAASASIEDQTALSVLGKLRIASQRLGCCGSVEELCQVVTQELRALTGYDRIMVYQFDDVWNGAVIAESRVEGLEPYLGLHYPASDIPAPARAMFLLNRIRLIPDARYQPVPLFPPEKRATPGTPAASALPLTKEARDKSVPLLPPAQIHAGQPLDLSRAGLRSVSPIHLEYLRNMGVRATLTISLVVNGKLWGLIACHHHCPRLPSPTLREVCELFGRLVSGQLTERAHAAGDTVAEQSQEALRRFSERVQQFESIIPALLADEHDLLALTNAQGAVLWRDGEAFSVGVTPPIDSIRKIQHWVAAATQDPIYFTDCLSKRFQDAEAYADIASGILALALARSPDVYILWFRPELIRTVDWAGDPNKSLQQVGDDGRVQPRKSFALWQESVRNRSRPWSKSELAAVERLQAILQPRLARAAERLSRLLPLCAWCKKVRSDDNYWQQVEAYVSQQTDIRFTHGLCPSCLEKEMQAL